MKKRATGATVATEGIVIKKYAHFILAAWGGFCVSLISCFGTQPILWLTNGTQLILILAFWYEWRQAVDNGLKSKYGSLANFQKDSRGDVRQDLTGLFAGLFVGLIISSVLVKLI